MKLRILTVCLLASFGIGVQPNPVCAQSETRDSEKTPKNALDFELKNIEGKMVSLKEYRGKVVLAVNVASKCGFTPQYETLQKLHEEHASDGLVILGFPCNQFGRQEPGSEFEIQQFCQENYGVEFPMFAKLNVKGKEQSSFYRYLTQQNSKPVGKGDVRWNFEKFLIDREGNVAARFGSRTAPDSKEFQERVNELLKADKSKG